MICKEFPYKPHREGSLVRFGNLWKPTTNAARTVGESFTTVALKIIFLRACGTECCTQNLHNHGSIPAFPTPGI